MDRLTAALTLKLPPRRPNTPVKNPLTGMNNKAPVGVNILCKSSVKSTTLRIETMKPLRTIVFTTVWLFLATTLHAQQCLHGTNETPDQKQRRQSAVAALRTINTAQITYFIQTRHYGTLQELATSPIWAKLLSGRNAAPLSTAPNTDLLPGFELSMTASATGWSVSLKDKDDPCAFTAFSNEAGIIFTGYPIDFVVTPTKSSGN